MVKKTIRRGTCIVLVILMLSSALWYTNEVLRIKRTDGVTTMQGLYAQKDNTVDVLLLGSSHAGMNLDASVLWSEYGIASYCPWGSIQPFWNSYYSLIEALKTQNPKVVVLDVYAATMQFEYSDDARQATNTVGMRFSANKISAVQASAPKERWADLLLGLPIYHERYTELTENDFKHFPWSKEQINQKGTDCRYGHGNFQLCDVSGITEQTPLYVKEEQYLRQIIEYCNSLNLPLVLITTPTVEREREQPYYNSVASIANEYGIEFYNFNLMDQQSGFCADDYWEDGHVNTDGARKITSLLGKLLKEKYDIPDHKGEEDYRSWDIHAETTENKYIAQITETDDYFSELARTSKMVFVVKNSSWPDDEQFSHLLDEMGKIGVNTEELRKSGGGDWILTDTIDGSFDNRFTGDMYSSFMCNGGSFAADFANGEGISVNGQKVYDLNGAGIICVVYDPIMQCCVDVATFLVDDSFVLNRP